MEYIDFLLIFSYNIGVNIDSVLSDKREDIIKEEHIGKVLSVKDFRTMPERIFPLHVLYLMTLMDKEKEEK